MMFEISRKSVCLLAHKRKAIPCLVSDHLCFFAFAINYHNDCAAVANGRRELAVGSGRGWGEACFLQKIFVSNS